MPVYTLKLSGKVGEFYFALTCVNPVPSFAPRLWCVFETHVAVRVSSDDMECSGGSQFSLGPLPAVPEEKLWRLGNILKGQVCSAAHVL